MSKLAATLEFGSKVPPDSPTEVMGQPTTFSPNRTSMKFAFVSGSRPLDGYTLKRGIGRGGFGEVYFAISDAGKEVALKKIEKNLDVELRGVVQCLNLRHANLVEIYDVKYDEQGEPWVVMEYISGSVLKDVLDANPRGLPYAEVSHWFRGIAAGVAYLHDHGLVHRDLKPANIFDDAGTVKIGDYGLSKYISSSRRHGQTESVGTCHYMAPEIGKGEYGKEIDIYALGIVLHELLTGTVPFDGESNQEVLMKHLTVTPDLGSIPEQFRGLIARTLDKNPQRRYASVDALLADFEIASGEEDHDSFEKTKREETADRPVPSSQSAQAIRSAEVLVLDESTTSEPSSPIYIDEDAADQATGISLGPLKRGPGKIAPRKVIPSNGNSTTHRSNDPRGSSSQISKFAGNSLAGTRPSSQRLGQPQPHSATRILATANGLKAGTVAKTIVVVLLLGLLGATIFFAPMLSPVVMLVAAGAVGWSVFREVSQIPRGVPPLSAGSATATPLLGSSESTATEILRWGLRMHTPWDRMAELSGAFLIASLVAAICCTIVTAMTGKLSAEPTELAFQAWLIISSCLGAWLILAVGKCWETSAGESWKRRFVLLTLGLSFGAICWGLNQMLLIHLTDDFRLGSMLSGLLPATLQSANQTPGLPLYLLYFGFSFAVVPWWKHVDPTRETRLSVGAILLVIFVALVFPFPQPWGMTIAVASSVAAQLAARWLNSNERIEIERRWKHARS